MLNIPPPNTPELEREVLCVLLNDPNSLTRVEDTLTPDCFYDTEHRAIFEILFGLHLKGEEANFVRLVQALHTQGHDPEIKKTAATIKIGLSREYELFENINVLTSLRIQRDLLTSSYKIQQAIEKQKGIDEITKLTNGMADVVNNQRRSLDNITLADSIQEMREKLSQPLKNGLSGVNTGLGIINTFTGGWQDSDVIIIAARPGMGKTVAGTVHAYHAAKAGIPTAYITMEVPKWKITARIVASLTGINFGDITKQNLVDHQRKRVNEAAASIERLPLYFYDDKNSRDINDIALTMRSWKRKYGIGLVIIDYIQLIRDRTVKDSSDATKVVTQVSMKTKELQSHLGCPIIELAQLNRENEAKSNKRPGLENLKQAGQLEQDASTVIFLYREDYYEMKEAYAKGQVYVPTNNLEYIFAKHREGEIGTINLKCNPGYNQIYEDPN